MPGRWPSASGAASRSSSGGSSRPQLKAALPYELTDDQKQAIREVTADMTAPERMHRLLMGDVGTGKTIVALFAMLLAVENDFQAALMAPTELLAEQHARRSPDLLAPLGIVPEVLLGRMTAAAKSAARGRLGAGQRPRRGGDPRADAGERRASGAWGWW